MPSKVQKAIVPTQIVNMGKYEDLSIYPQVVYSYPQPELLFRFQGL